jgi:hypothetical protein
MEDGDSLIERIEQMTADEFDESQSPNPRIAHFRASVKWCMTY